MILDRWKTFTKEIGLRYPDRLEQDKEIGQFTTMGLRGRSRCFFEARNSDEFTKLLESVGKYRLPVVLLGGGSNTIVASPHLDTLVIRITSRNVAKNENDYLVDAGVPLDTVIRASTSDGLSGLTWAAGIPGTIGGAVCGNAGAFGTDIGGLVDYVEVWHERCLQRIPAKDFGFRYRHSLAKELNIPIIRINLKLNGNFDPGMLEDDYRARLEIRRQRLPLEPSAGCVFKNITVDPAIEAKFQERDLPETFRIHGKIPAGWLLEQVGAKELSFNSVAVSKCHANIIIAKDNPQSKEYFELIAELKRRVLQVFGILLEEEVVLLV